MSTTNFKTGNNIGIVLAETAQQKFFENYDIEAAKNIFIESIGCNDEFADKLFKGEYVLVKNPDDERVVNCIERDDLSEEDKKKFPALDPAIFVLSFFAKINETNANNYIQDLREVRDAIYKDLTFHIDADLSDILLKDVNAVVYADIHLSAREIVKIIVREDETSNEFSAIYKNSYLTHAKGMLQPNIFVKYISDIVFIKNRRDNILNTIEYFENGKFKISDKIEYDFFKIKSIVNFASELYSHIAEDFVNIQNIYKTTEQ